MFRMNQQTLPVPNPGDWCSIKHAADVLGVDYQTVWKWRNTGILTGHRALGGTPLCWVPEVLELRAARERARRRD